MNLNVLEISYENSAPATAWADVSTSRFKVWNEKQSSIGIQKLWGYTSNFSTGSLKITISCNLLYYFKH